MPVSRFPGAPPAQRAVGNVGCEVGYPLLGLACPVAAGFQPFLHHPRHLQPQADAEVCPRACGTGTWPRRRSRGRLPSCGRTREPSRGRRRRKGRRCRQPRGAPQPSQAILVLWRARRTAASTLPSRPASPSRRRRRGKVEGPFRRWPSHASRGGESPAAGARPILGAGPEARRNPSRGPGLSRAPLHHSLSSSVSLQKVNRPGRCSPGGSPLARYRIIVSLRLYPMNSTAEWEKTRARNCAADHGAARYACPKSPSVTTRLSAGSSTEPCRYTMPVNRSRCGNASEANSGTEGSPRRSASSSKQAERCRS